MTVPVQNEQAPAFQAVDVDGREVAVPDSGGRSTLVMFFQEAGTPACTTQVRSVCAEAAVLGRLGVETLFLSTDGVGQLQAFARTLPGGPRMISDTGGAIARQFGVFDEAVGRANRAAFVVDGCGAVKLAFPWYNPANTEQLLAIFESLGLGETPEGDQDG